MILVDEPYHQYLQAREMMSQISWPSPHWKKSQKIRLPN